MEATAPSPGFVEMQLRGLILDPQSESPVVILRKAGESLFLPIWIGVFEANAIALALEAVRPKRPMTHDLLCASIEAMGGTLERIEIHSILEGTFHARLIVRRMDGPLAIDARPSDAIAIALRAGASIWASLEVLEQSAAAAVTGDLSDEKRLLEWLENAKAEDLGKYSM